MMIVFTLFTKDLLEIVNCRWVYLSDCVSVLLDVLRSCHPHFYVDHFANGRRAAIFFCAVDRWGFKIGWCPADVCSTLFHEPSNYLCWHWQYCLYDAQSWSRAHGALFSDKRCYSFILIMIARANILWRHTKSTTESIVGFLVFVKFNCQSLNLGSVSKVWRRCWNRTQMLYHMSKILLYFSFTSLWC